MESLNLTIADSSQKPREFEVKFFKGEQRKIYRDEISPLNDKDRKALKTVGINDVAADRKRIIIAPILQIEQGSIGTSHSGGKRYYTNLYFSTKDRLRHHEPTEIYDIKERDMVEIHFAYYPDGDRRVVLRPTKVTSFKRERPNIEDLRQQVFFKDEIVPLTEKDKEKIKQKVSAAKGCAVFFAVPSAAFAVYWFFFSANETVWRFVFGGVGALGTILCAAAWLITRWGSNDEIKINKKRVIVAPVADLSTRTVLGKPTKFYATIKTVADTLGREIPAETYMDLKVGDIIKMEITKKPGGLPTTLQEVIKIADAPEENKTGSETAEI